MTLFRLFLIAIWLVLAAYSGLVIAQHGANLLPVFFGDIAAISWPGQFNLDFLMMLSLSAIWVAWRHRFSSAGFALAALALVGGIMVLAPYVLVASIRAKGDAKRLLLGDQI